jgi:hypothetical protein
VPDTAFVRIDLHHRGGQGRIVTVGILAGYGALVAMSSNWKKTQWQPQSSEPATSVERWRGIWSAAVSPSSSRPRTKRTQRRSRKSLGELARAGSVEGAIAEADAVVFAVWLDTIKELIAKDAGLLDGKVVVDPSNPLGFDENEQMVRTLPDDQSAGSVVAGLLPAGVHYVQAFGTLGADGVKQHGALRLTIRRACENHRR